jgi:hypothetical protein
MSPSFNFRILVVVVGLVLLQIWGGAGAPQRRSKVLQVQDVIVDGIGIGSSSTNTDSDSETNTNFSTFGFGYQNVLQAPPTRTPAVRVVEPGKLQVEPPPIPTPATEGRTSNALDSEEIGDSNDFEEFSYEVELEPREEELR